MVAMQVTIAKGIAIEYFRGHKRPTISIDDVGELEGIEQDPAVLEAGEMQFYIRELLKHLSAKCRILYELWLELLNLKLVAERMCIRHDDARQSWVRCRVRALKFVIADDSELGIRVRTFLETI